ncbi:NADPH-dependent FMN reductase [Microvirga antarctica]|uniref:NADPH-dependent FMN reductase n=1 Tax=Microvirga antarctica TaxID=2819233 RepID=UPI001B3144DC|nr:NAD(P)H-dependent oxidoreductase [Microvirga antarctica]
MALKLHTIICSTRPGRAGPIIGKWFNDLAKEHGQFDATLVDLADFNLPVYDEPFHPRLQKYEHAHTKAWSESVKAADAYVFVTPEYNYAPPPSLINALDFVFTEWNYKAAGFVSYGGVSGGLRAVQMAKQIVTTVKVMPVTEGVSIPNYPTFIDEAKTFKPNDLILASVKPMLDEIHRWAAALKPMRG